MTPVAFFDFDGTLTTGDTLMPFLRFVAGDVVYYTKLALVSPILAAYFAGVLRNDIAKQIVLKVYIGGYQYDKLEAKGRLFADEALPTMLRRVGMERLQWHQDRGHRCVLVSASFGVYLRYWAEKQGFTSIISSQLDVTSDNRVSGRIKEKNCYADEKVIRIEKWIQQYGAGETYAYGDTSGDYPMLKRMDYSWILRNDRFVNINQGS